MQIFVNIDNAIGLAEAAKLLSVGGRRPHVSTLWRWCKRGVRGVRLPYARFGNRIVTSREALEHFSRALAAADDAGTPATGSSSRMQHDHERAERECKSAGL